MQTTFFANAAGAAAEWVVAWVLAMRDKLRTRKNMRKAMVVVVCMASSFVLAQLDGGAPMDPEAHLATSPSAEIPSAPKVSTYPYADVTQIVAVISGAVQNALDKISGGGALKQMGNQILAFLLVLMMVWTSLRTMAGGKGFGELIGEWVPVFVAFGVAYLFVNDQVASSIVRTMDAIGTAIGGQSMASLQSSIAAIMEPIFRSFQAVWQMPRVTSQTSLLDNLSVGSAMAKLMSPLLTGLLKILTVFLILISGVITLATVVMAHLSLHLALLLAPVLVPFLLFKPMSWLFDGWLKFLLGACMLKIVVAFFLTIASALLGAMNTVAGMVYAEATSASPLDGYMADALMHGLMVGLAILTTLLMISAPGIATGLLSGSAGSTGFGGIRGLTQSPSGRIASSAASGTGIAAGRGIAGTAKAGSAAIEGRKSGASLRGVDGKTRTGVSAKAYEAAHNFAANRRQGPVLPRSHVLASKK